RLAGASPGIAVDVRADPLKLAPGNGGDAGGGARMGDVAEAVRRANGGRGVDVAGEFIGQAATIEAAFASLTKGGRVVVVGLGQEPVRLPPSGVFARREMSLLGSGGFSRHTIERLLGLASSGRLALEGS